jgi:Nuclease-related domain
LGDSDFARSGPQAGRHGGSDGSPRMPADTSAGPPDHWRVRYDGACSRCWAPLRVGDAAVYDRTTRSIRCVECPTNVEDVATERFETKAGGSARREYERRKAKRESRVRDKFGRAGGLVLAMTDDPQSTRAWATGSRGEEMVAKALSNIEGLRVLNDRRVPGTRGNIDHIVVGPAGVFVVDTKNYQGRIQIRNLGSFFRPDHRLYVGRHDCSVLATGLGWQVDAVLSVLTATGMDPLPPVAPVLCFVGGDWPLFSPPDQYGGVHLASTKSIRKLVATPEILDVPSVERIADLLRVALRAK